MNNRIKLEKKRAIEVIDNICNILEKDERKGVMDWHPIEKYTIEQIRLILNQRWRDVVKGCKYIYEKATQEAKS